VLTTSIDLNAVSDTHASQPQSQDLKSKIRSEPPIPITYPADSHYTSPSAGQTPFLTLTSPPMPDSVTMAHDIELSHLDKQQHVSASGSILTAHDEGHTPSHKSISTVPQPSTSSQQPLDDYHNSRYSSDPADDDDAQHDHTFRGHFNHFIDSFRRQNPPSYYSSSNRSSLPRSLTYCDDFDVDLERHQPIQRRPRHKHKEDGRFFDLRSASTKTASTLLARELKARHLQMIAISGSIGTGLFVASGKALSEGGPASVVLAYVLVGVMMYCTMQALGELAVVFPVAGSYSAFSTRFLDPSWGFAMGWK